VDCTWGDPVPNIPNQVDYTYFNITDAEMDERHRYTSSVSCTATKYNYWNAFTSEIYVADIDEFYQCAAGKIKAGESRFRIVVESRNLPTVNDIEKMSGIVGKNVIYSAKAGHMEETVGGITCVEKGDWMVTVNVNTDIVEGENLFNNLEDIGGSIAKSAEEGMDSITFAVIGKELMDLEVIYGKAYSDMPYYVSIRDNDTEEIGKSIKKIVLYFEYLGDESTRAENEDELKQMIENFVNNNNQSEIVFYLQVDNIDTFNRAFAQNSMQTYCNEKGMEVTVSYRKNTNAASYKRLMEVKVTKR